MSHVSRVLCMAFCLVAPGVLPAADAAPVGEEIAAAIRTQVASMERWKDADIRIELSNRLNSADLPAEGDSWRIASEGLKIGRRNVLVPIEVLRGGKQVRSFWVPAVAHVQSVAVTAARRITAGETVTEADVREARVETTDLGVAWTRSVREVFGKTARHDFASGAPLSTEAFAETPTVRRGDTVNLRLERDGIVLTSTAKAVDDGRMGDVIRVKSTAFSSGERVLRVRVAGRSAVTVQ